MNLFSVSARVGDSRNFMSRQANKLKKTQKAVDETGRHEMPAPVRHPAARRIGADVQMDEQHGRLDPPETVAIAPLERAAGRHAFIAITLTMLLASIHGPRGGRTSPKLPAQISPRLPCNSPSPNPSWPAFCSAPPRRQVSSAISTPSRPASILISSRASSPMRYVS